MRPRPAAVREAGHVRSPILRCLALSLPMASCWRSARRLSIVLYLPKPRRARRAQLSHPKNNWNCSLRFLIGAERISCCGALGCGGWSVSAAKANHRRFVHSYDNVCSLSVRPEPFASVHLSGAERSRRPSHPQEPRSSTPPLTRLRPE
jgi:hypothetical protein